MKRMNWNKLFPEYTRNADWETNAKSIMHYLAKSNEFLKIMAKRIEEYDETLSLSLENIHTILNGYMEDWEQNLQDFPDDVKILLEKWLDDGTLDHIINETIFSWKADKADVDEMFHTISTQLENIGHMPDLTQTTDIATTIQNLYDNIPENSTLKIPSGYYEIDKTLLFNRKVHIDATGVIFEYTGNDTVAIQIGDESQSISDLLITNINVRKKTQDWESDNVGIRIVNINSSIFVSLSARFFTRGIVVDGFINGNAYNKYFLGVLYNNKESLVITSSNGGWSNENIFYGGRFGWTSSIPSTEGNTHLLVDYIDYSNNNNKFYGLSFENGSSDKSGYAVKIIQGRNNAVRDCRYEGSEKVYIEEGYSNVIEDGFALADGDIEDNGNGTKVITRDSIKYVLNHGLNIHTRSSNANTLLTTRRMDGTESFSVDASGDMKARHAIFGGEVKSTHNRGYFRDGVFWRGEEENVIRGIYNGVGSPEGEVTANPGSMYLNRTGGSNTTLYIKETGNDNTGWVAK